MMITNSWFYRCWLSNTNSSRSMAAPGSRWRDCQLRSNQGPGGRRITSHFWVLYELAAGADDSTGQLSCFNQLFLHQLQLVHQSSSPWTEQQNFWENMWAKAARETNAWSATAMPVVSLKSWEPQGRLWVHTVRCLHLEWWTHQLTSLPPLQPSWSVLQRSKLIWL